MDIRYATTNNFLHEAVYNQPRCFVLEVVALKLDSIQKELQKKDLGLKVFDGYRPLSVQRKMWELLPDERFVANPAFGSLHNRGAAIDVSLVDSSGNELEMPTDYGDFTERAYLTYNGLPENIQKNRDYLKEIMGKYGFDTIETEWWHYHIRDYDRYQILDLSFEEIDAMNQKNSQ